MELPSLNEQHRRIAEEARKRIGYLMSGQALEDLVGKIDTRYADAINTTDAPRIQVNNVEAPVATETELESGDA